MKKINLKILIITFLTCLFPIILGVSVYDKLPDQVPIHFDINNNPNNYASKTFAVLGLPVIMSLIQLFLCVMTDLTDENREENKQVSTIVKWVIPTITIVLYIVTLGFALGYNLDIRKIVMILLGIWFIIMGICFPKAKGRIYIHLPGVDDEETLGKLAKLLGVVFIIYGAAFVISTFLKPIVSAILVVFFIIDMIAFSIYGYIKGKDK